MYRYQGKAFNLDSVYRFLEKLNDKLFPRVELIPLMHTLKALNNKISVVFYNNNMGTLNFEASYKDESRETGFCKEGKHQ